MVNNILITYHVQVLRIHSIYFRPSVGLHEGRIKKDNIND